MSALSISELTVQDLLEDVRHHLAYRPEINSEGEAIQALKGLPPFTYMLRKGFNQLSYFVSFVTEEHTIISEEFRINEEKRQYQYYDRSWIHDRNEWEALKKEDPYFLELFSDLDNIIFLAAMKCDRCETEALV